jgi:hypothetical protein
MGISNLYGVYAAIPRVNHKTGELLAKNMKEWVRRTCSGVDFELLKCWMEDVTLGADMLRYKSMIAMGADSDTTTPKSVPEEWMINNEKKKESYAQELSSPGPSQRVRPSTPEPPKRFLSTPESPELVPPKVQKI